VTVDGTIAVSLLGTMTYKMIQDAAKHQDWRYGHR